MFSKATETPMANAMTEIISAALFQFAEAYGMTKTEQKLIGGKRLTAKEAAVYLDVDYGNLCKLCREEKIPHHMIGGKYIFLQDKLDEWIADGMDKSIHIEPAQPYPLLTIAKPRKVYRHAK